MKLWPQLETKIKVGFAIAACWAGQVLAALPAPAAAPQESSASKSSQAAYEAAAREYENQVKLQPQSAKAWSNLGVTRAMAGDCPQALPVLDRARSLDPTLPTPWLFSGSCDLTLHHDAKALRELETACRLNPRDANAWFLRAQAAGNLNELDESIEAAVRALALDPGNAAAYYVAGQDGLSLAAQAYNRVYAHAAGDLFYQQLLDGQRAAAQKNWAIAIDRYQLAQKAEPDDPEIDFSLGSAYLEMGRYPEAQAAFEQCLRNAPGLVWVKLRLALALAEQSERGEAVKIVQSIPPNGWELPAEYQDYVAAAALLGLHREAHEGAELGKKRFKDYEWPDWFKGTESTDVAGSEPGDQSIKLQDLTGVGLSIRFFLTADHLAGNYVERAFPSEAAYQGFRAAFLAQNWVTAAERSLPLLRASKLMSDCRSAFVLGETLQSLSYGFYQDLALKFPNSELTTKLAAENFEAMGQQDKALEIYDTALRENGPSPGLLRDIARVYWTQHDWDQALKVLSSLTAMDPNDPTILVNMGRIHLYQDNVQKAAECFRQAVSLDPGMFEARLGLGQILRRQNDDPNALKEFEAAARIDPKNPRPHYQISQICRKLGEKDRAAVEMQEFQRLQSLAGTAVLENNKLLVPLD
ncbi:MAG TPA: tetratricopeptide repeat protein [Terriglobia bacterium]|nr:tetratricopeptide repeat protein [Terriglobia bacterium]